MTSKQIYEATAIELSKVQAPTLKLYEFNYFFNQAIRQFVNKVYNYYDVNQQTTDDLRVLKSTATLKPTAIAVKNDLGDVDINKYLAEGTYYVDMPNDYLHLLNCVCLFKVNKQKDCWDEGDIMQVGATKLTADSWSSIMDDVYNKPSKKRPYYYIHNQPVTANSVAVDKLHTMSSSDITTSNGTTTVSETNSNFPRTFNGENVIEKTSGSRQANASNVRIEIRCGAGGNSVFELKAIQIDYVKAPQFIRLTQEQLDCDEDISQVMEFPDYVNQEIINELVNLVMRKTNDPSLQAHMQMTQSIARPTGQQAQQ